MTTRARCGNGLRACPRVALHGVGSVSGISQPDLTTRGFSMSVSKCRFPLLMLLVLVAACQSPSPSDVQTPTPYPTATPVRITGAGPECGFIINPGIFTERVVADSTDCIYRWDDRVEGRFSIYVNGHSQQLHDLVRLISVDGSWTLREGEQHGHRYYEAARHNPGNATDCASKIVVRYFDVPGGQESDFVTISIASAACETDWAKEFYNTSLTAALDSFRPG